MDNMDAKKHDKRKKARANFLSQKFLNVND